MTVPVEKHFVPKRKRAPWVAKDPDQHLSKQRKPNPPRSMAVQHTGDILPFIIPEVVDYRAGKCCSGLWGEQLLTHGADHDFSVKLLAWALQQPSIPLSSFQTYLDGYNSFVIQTRLKWLIKCGTEGKFLPILMFAVERNSPQLVDLLCKAGADPKARAMPSGLPVLRYCVISAEYDISDTTDTLVALLAAGASPADIPKDLWEHYTEAPKKTDPNAGKDAKDRVIDPNGCTLEIRRALCRTLTLLQRYYLWKATLLGGTTEVMRQVAEAHNIEALFQVHCHIVGQLPAAQQVINNITSHYLLQSNRPLVLLFTGPSGHGKTELARHLGSLLWLNIIQIDCTEMRIEMDLFGPKSHWHGGGTGSPLNNFLVEHSGSRSVVFLDEFEKTTDEVRRALLLVLDSGFYKSRIDGKQIDCSKTIWIMATNDGEAQIQKFWATHLENIPQHRHLSAPFHLLQAQLKRAFIDTFGAPVTGRISAIIPFLPFTKDEQAVVTYTFMRELKNEVRKDIDVGAKYFARHLHLNFINDGKIVKYLADQGYTAELGARSLRNAVQDQIAHKLALEFLKGEERVADETNEIRGLVRYDVRVIAGPEIEVKKTGVTKLQSKSREEDLDSLFGDCLKIEDADDDADVKR